MDHVDFRWRRLQDEFQASLRWRVWVVLTLAACDLVVAGVNGTTEGISVPLYTGYLSIAAVLWWLRRTLGPRSTPVLFPLSLCVDVFVISIALHTASGGYWLGPSLYAIVVLVASALLDRLGIVLVTTVTILVFVGKGLLEMRGIWTFGSPLSPPSEAFLSSFRLVSDHLVFGVVTLVIIALLQSLLVRRLARSEETQRAIVESSSDLLLVVELDGSVRSANPAAVRALGEIEQIRAIDWITIDGGGNRDALLPALAAAIEGRVAGVEADVRFEDGRRRRLAVTCSPVREAGVVSAVVLSGRDLTDERAAAEEREELQRQLEESRRTQLVGRLVSGVAHELNNPLSAILSHAELLRETDLAPDGAVSRTGSAGLDTIVHESRRAREIVRDLLQVARAEQARSPRPTRLAELVADSIEALHPDARARDIELRLVASHPVVARVDPVGIGQVVTNLLTNAMHAIEQCGLVEVRVEQHGEIARILVEDDGPGIAPEVRAHIFEPFVTTKAAGVGTGLGLAVCLGIVEQNGGRLAVEAARDGAARPGARFTVELPVLEGIDGAVDVEHEVAPGAGLADPPASRPAVPAGLRVLIIDDERGIRGALRGWFELHGWHATECVDGADALDVLAGGRPLPDLVLCDLRMPRISGPEFFEQLVEVAPSLRERLIFLTGDTMSDQARAFLARSNVTMLPKPFEFRALQIAVVRVLGSATPPGDVRNGASGSP